MVHAQFDALYRLLSTDLIASDDAPRFSQQRRVVGTAPGGWSILLDTNTSAADFVTVERTPGALPRPQ